MWGLSTHADGTVERIPGVFVGVCVPECQSRHSVINEASILKKRGKRVVLKIRVRIGVWKDKDVLVSGVALMAVCCCPCFCMSSSLSEWRRRVSRRGCSHCILLQEYRGA